MTRRTKIVCTLGPASDSDATIEALLLAGMDVARLNFSHGTQETHAATLVRLRAVAERLGRPLAVLQDLQGPKIRTGALAGGKPITLHDGQRFTITTRQIEGHSQGRLDHLRRVSAGREAGRSHPALRWRDRAARAGDQGQDTITEVVHGGVLAEHQGINLPGVAVSAPALTPKDRDDLAFGVRQGVDYIALSFVRKPEDIEEAKRLVAEQTPKSAQPIPGHRQAGEAGGHRAAGRDSGGVGRRDGGAWRSGRRTAAGAGAADPEAGHQQRRTRAAFPSSPRHRCSNR